MTDQVTERVAVVARLQAGLARAGAGDHRRGRALRSRSVGFRRHSVFLAETAVIFVFEGSGIEELVRALVDDPTRSAAFSVWGPLLEGTPALAREEFYWEAG